MQPLLARQCGHLNGQPTYELVFGHRRLRASRLAGLQAVPVMVRALSDAQAARLQAIENLQREDLDPIEEAQGFADYRKQHKLSVDDIADQIGLSRTSVYNQLKLVSLCAEGKRLVSARLLDKELGTQVARLGAASVQTSALQALYKGAELESITEKTPALSYRQGLQLLAKFGDKAEASTTPEKAPKQAKTGPAEPALDVAVLRVEQSRALQAAQRGYDHCMQAMKTAATEPEKNRYLETSHAIGDAINLMRNCMYMTGSHTQKDTAK
jgi:ParB/RepB/Spo0J family partition protein